MGWMGLGLLATAERNSVGFSSSRRVYYSVLHDCSAPCSWRDGIYIYIGLLQDLEGKPKKLARVLTQSTRCSIPSNI